MMFPTLIRILLYGVTGFRRHIWLSVIAVITMTMTLMTVTVFALTDVIAAQQQKALENNIDYVIFVKDEASDTDVSVFITQIEAQPQVKDVRLLSKEDARKEFENTLGSVPELQGLISEERNPLPRQIIVGFNKVEDITTFDQYAEQDRFKEIVFDTSFRENQDIIKNYINTANLFKVIGFFFTAFFILVAFMVIFNVIRLAIHSRRQEIEIMRLVGASPGFIKGPFVVEAFLYALLSTVAASSLTYVMLGQLKDLVEQSYATGGNTLSELLGPVLTTNGDASLTSVVSYLFVLQLLVAIILGVLCSGVAVRRYLKEA
jgi:cell division transport system permease protein